MTGLIYNEVSKIVAQRRFVVVSVLLTIMAIVSALGMRGITGGLGVTAAQMIATVATGGFAQLMFPFLLAIIAGDIVAGELTAGTMKLLLIRPVSRWKIWLSKFLATYLTGVAMLSYCAACVYVALGAATGFGSFSSIDPVNGGHATTASVTLQAYGLEMVSLLSVVSVLMLISTLVESGVAAVGISTTLVMMCSILVPLHIFFQSKWIEYLFYEHWQIAGYATGSFPVTYWSLTGSLVVLGVWTTCCIGAAVAIFQYRDVKS